MQLPGTETLRVAAPATGEGGARNVFHLIRLKVSVCYRIHGGAIAAIRGIGEGSAYSVVRESAAKIDVHFHFRKFRQLTLRAFCSV